MLKRKLPKKGRIIKTRCPNCEKKGRDRKGDNLAIYSDGHGYCFSCGFYLDKNSNLDYNVYYVKNRDSILLCDNESQCCNVTLDSNVVQGTMYTYQYLEDRGVTKDTMSFFEVATKVAEDGAPISRAFDFGSYVSVRTLPKKFHVVGDDSDVKLFGQSKFNPGEMKDITICEGPEDAMSLYQTLGKNHAVVSVRSASLARIDCAREYNYINSFDRIYICFDNDPPGLEASREVASLFDVNKVYFVKLEKWKDANEALLDNPVSLKHVWQNARRYEPAGVVSELNDLKAILSREDAATVAEYPFPTLSGMTYGMRLGELVLVTALEKIGKTEFLRSIEYNLLKTTQHRLGIIHLEEQEKRCVQGLVGYHLARPVHLPDSGVSLAEQERALESLVGETSRLNIYSRFGSNDPNDVLSLIRYLAGSAQCKFIFLDHLTMLVSGMETDDERRKLDYLSTQLARMTRDLNFTLFLVSHVNDEGQTRGSRMPSKLCDLEIYLSRDKEAFEASARNKTNIMVRNNRFAGATGPAGTLVFDRTTWTLKEEVANEENKVF